MLAVALEAEVEAYIAAFADERDDAGRRLVVRNGHARPRQVTTVAGAIEVHAPRVDDRRVEPATGQRCRFRSSILPPWWRRSAEGDRGAAAAVSAWVVEQGLCPGVGGVFRLERGAVRLDGHAVDYRLAAGVPGLRRADLSEVDYVYVWVEGIHFTVRLEKDRVCTLVIIGVRADGKKELVALSDGHRESTESWADLLREGKRRGMRAPVLAVGDGALGFWAALREVFPQNREQRDWVHKAANVLDALPKSAHPAARKALAEIRDAEDPEHARKAITAFANLFGTKHPKAVAKVVEDAEQLLTFYDFPAEHWVHLKTSNPIESAFATVRLRTRVTKGPGSRAAGLAMVFKLMDAASETLAYLNAAHLVALVRAGATFEKGVLIERPDEAATRVAA
jgi:putative transposase